MHRHGTATDRDRLASLADRAETFLTTPQSVTYPDDQRALIRAMADMLREFVDAVRRPDDEAER